MGDEGYLEYFCDAVVALDSSVLPGRSLRFNWAHQGSQPRMLPVAKRYLKMQRQKL